MSSEGHALQHASHGMSCQRHCQRAKTRHHICENVSHCDLKNEIKINETKATSEDSERKLSYSQRNFNRECDQPREEESWQKRAHRIASQQIRRKFSQRDSRNEMESKEIKRISLELGRESIDGQRHSDLRYNQHRVVDSTARRGALEKKWTSPKIPVGLRSTREDKASRYSKEWSKDDSRDKNRENDSETMSLEYNDESYREYETSSESEQLRYDKRDDGGTRDNSKLERNRYYSKNPLGSLNARQSLFSTNHKEWNEDDSRDERRANDPKTMPADYSDDSDREYETSSRSDQLRDGQRDDRRIYDTTKFERKTHQSKKQMTSLSARKSLSSTHHREWNEGVGHGEQQDNDSEKLTRENWSRIFDQERKYYDKLFQEAEERMNKIMKR